MDTHTHTKTYTHTLSVAADRMGMGRKDSRQGPDRKKDTSREKFGIHQMETITAATNAAVCRFPLIFSLLEEMLPHTHTHTLLIITFASRHSSIIVL